MTFFLIKLPLTVFSLFCFVLPTIIQMTIILFLNPPILVLFHLLFDVNISTEYPITNLMNEGFLNFE